MNPRIEALFSDKLRLDKLVLGLPRAFEMASREMPAGNPAVGILREHILTGFFISEFGDLVGTDSGGITRGRDITLDGIPLSIKTVTGNGEIKVLWTVDPLKIGMEISRDYTPSYDIFLVNVFWGKNRDSVFYIPTEVQREIHDLMKDRYLKANVGTNHRGIAISSQAMREIKNDKRVLRCTVDWQKTGLNYSPYVRWQEYWTQTSPVV